MGAFVGGFATYLGTKSIEESKADAAAKGVARVLQTRLSTVDIRLRYMLVNERLVARDSSFVIDLPIDDEELVASNVSAEAWERVVTGLEALRNYVALDSFAFRRADANLEVPLGSDLRGWVQETHRLVERARAALGSLSGIA